MTIETAFSRSTKTSEENIATWRLAQSIRKSPALSSAVLASSDVDAERLSIRDAGHRIRSCRRVYERYRHKEPLRGWQTFDDDDELPDDGRGLRRIGASSGIVTGLARGRCWRDEISRIEKGDILVTVATDPGWTAVFSIIRGVVVETGRIVAHAVMISHEYGIPCIANLTRACEQVQDGDVITVDRGTRTFTA